MIFAVVQQQAEQAKLPPSSAQKIDKARRVLPAMVATLAWFWVQVQTLSRGLALSPAEHHGFCQRVLPAASWEQAAPRGRNAAEKQASRPGVEELGEQMEALRAQQEGDTPAPRQALPLAAQEPVTVRIRRRSEESATEKSNPEGTKSS